MLKSAITAAKKKNNLNDEIIFLIGDEDQVPTKALPSNSKSTRTVSTSETPVPVRAKVEKTPSFKDTLSKINSIAKVKKNLTELDSPNGSNDSVSKSKNAFTQSDIDNFWGKFVEKLRKNDIRMYSALNSVQAILSDNYLVEINLQNNSQIEEFQTRLKPSILSELRELLKNDYIDIIARVTDSAKLERPKFFNDKEKLELMIEKNPSLLLLKNKFTLDFD